MLLHTVASMIRPGYNLQENNECKKDYNEK